MRVVCKKNDLNLITEPEVKKRLSRSIRIQGPTDSYDIGNEYTVQAIGEMGGGLWFYLETVQDDCPYPCPIEMFEIIDNSIPEGWCIKFHNGNIGTQLQIMTFPEWVNDDVFYERLIDSDPEAVAIYKSKRTS